VDVEPAAGVSQDEQDYDEDGDFEGSQWDGSELQNIYHSLVVERSRQFHSHVPFSHIVSKCAFTIVDTARCAPVKAKYALICRQEEMEEHSEDDEDEEEDVSLR
jgi:hypothetical protein